MAFPYTVYWQPGCTSCLRAKEFLTSHGIDFESINVLEVDSAMDTLAELGARSIPVVTRDNEFVFAQDIDVLAKFVGIDLNRKVLPPEILVERIELVLAAAQRYLAQLPPAFLSTKLPGRDRTYLDLAYHVFMIPIAFLDAAKGGELTFEHFERVPPPDMTKANQVIKFGDSVRDSMKTWWSTTLEGGLPPTVKTYYGQHSTHSVLERTAWHTAQHTRQLMALVINQGLEPDGPLSDKELADLPLPDEVYDDEVRLAPA